MSAQYAIVSRTILNRWDPEKLEAVEGWEIRARWASTGTLLKVFVPAATYNATEVDTAIRAAGHLDDQIGALGSQQATPPPPAAG